MDLLKPQLRTSQNPNYGPPETLMEDLPKPYLRTYPKAVIYAPPKSPIMDLLKPQLRTSQNPKHGPPKNLTEDLPKP